MAHPIRTGRSACVGAAGLILGTFAILAAACVAPAFAQGSTGGTLGKTDQSLSGGTPQQKAPNVDKVPSAAVSIAGLWHWSANCSAIGNQQASFVLRQAGTKITGQFTGSGTWGSLENGKIVGNQLSFNRIGGPMGVSEHWTARVDGAQMQGSSTGAVSCTFSARRQ